MEVKTTHKIRAFFLEEAYRLVILLFVAFPLEILILS